MSDAYQHNARAGNCTAAVHSGQDLHLRSGIYGWIQVGCVDGDSHLAVAGWRGRGTQHGPSEHGTRGQHDH